MMYIPSDMEAAGVQEERTVAYRTNYLLQNLLDELANDGYPPTSVDPFLRLSVGLLEDFHVQVGAPCGAHIE